MAEPSANRIGVNFPAEDETKICAYLPVHPDDVIVTKWHLVRPRVLEIIDPLPWAILSVVRGQYQARSAIFCDESPLFSVGDHLIILVGAPTLSAHFWLDMAQQIYSLCLEYDLGYARVLFESVPYPLTAIDPFENLVAHFPDAVELAENLCMGSSFGPTEGTPTSATMGGTIKLQGENEEPMALLMSVFHPFKDLVNQEQRLSGWRHDLAQPITLKMPSLEAVNDWTTSLERSIKHMKSKIDTTQLPTTETHQGGAEKRQRTLGDDEASLRALKGATAGSSGSGFLRYGSGFKKGFDWSLSSFEDRTIDNISPTFNEVQRCLIVSKLSKEDIDEVLERYGEQQEVKIGRPKICSLVMKRGQTTGLTVGKINALTSNIMISELELNHKVTFEVHAVLGPRMHYNIVEGGDSGGWFLNMDSEWVGSVIGRHGLQQTFGLMLNSEALVKDIEEFTSKKVVYPP